MAVKTQVALENDLVTRMECRACGKTSLEEILDFGHMPLAGDFRSNGERVPLFPLAIDLCTHCLLLQVRENVPHWVIFSARYSYSSSTVPGLVRHFEAFARDVSDPASRPGNRLLEIGCNDGVFLKPLVQAGFDAYGIDASDNVVALAREKGLNVRQGVFSKAAAVALKEELGSFDVLTCSNVFAHNAEVGDFAEGVEHLLSPAGEFWVEVHDARGLFQDLQWDCFYHEHCFYWSIQALERCLREKGLFLKRYAQTKMHGGSLRAVFSRHAPSIDIREPEISPSDWSEFGKNCRRSRHLIHDAINSLPIRYAYGAAGRAVMLINWTGIAERLSFVVDGSPLRYGRMIPNTTVPVISETEFAEHRRINGWCFVTAHNYLEDIRRKVDAAFPRSRIKYVTPLPHVSIR